MSQNLFPQFFPKTIPPGSLISEYGFDYAMICVLKVEFIVKNQAFINTPF